jgi:signal transduction histidine kinase
VLVPQADAISETLHYRNCVNRGVQLAHRHGLQAVAIALAVAAQIELAFITEDGSRPLLIVLALAWTLPLMFATRFPLLAPIVILAGVVGFAFAAPETFSHATVPFLTVFVTAPLMGFLNKRKGALVSLGVLLAAIVLVSIQLPDEFFGNVLFLTLIFGGPWLLAFVLGTRTQQTRELRERAERAERERERLASEAVAEERARIARELHDVVAHSVSVMVVQAAGVRRLLKSDQEREREALLVVERIGREALTEMRRMLGVLRASGDVAALAPQPGMQHIDKLVDQARRAGLTVELEVVGEAVQLPTGLDLSAYRIVQEGLTNVLKHGEQAKAHVRVRYGADEIELEVVDEGETTAAAVTDDGHGLAGMRERVAVYGGEFEAGPREEGGFRVLARLPLAGAH